MAVATVTPSRVKIEWKVAQKIVTTDTTAAPVAYSFASTSLGGSASEFATSRQEIIYVANTRVIPFLTKFPGYAHSITITGTLEGAPISKAFADIKSLNEYISTLTPAPAKAVP